MALVTTLAFAALYDALQQLAIAKGATAFAHVDLDGDPTILTSDMDELALIETLTDRVIASFSDVTLAGTRS